MTAIYTLRDADEPLGESYGDFHVWEVAGHLLFYLWETKEHKFVDEILPLAGDWEAFFEL